MSLTPTDIPVKLLKKYDLNGPRYTSYPTAPHFSPDINHVEYKKHWIQSNNSNADLSIYTHIPFCTTRCNYCGCFTMTGQSNQTILNYLHALTDELSQIVTVINPERRIDQFAMGGGTPNSLSKDQLSFYLEMQFVVSILNLYHQFVHEFLL